MSHRKSKSKPGGTQRSTDTKMATTGSWARQVTICSVIPEMLQLWTGAESKRLMLGHLTWEVVQDTTPLLASNPPIPLPIPPHFPPALKRLTTSWCCCRASWTPAWGWGPVLTGAHPALMLPPPAVPCSWHFKLAVLAHHGDKGFKSGSHSTEIEMFLLDSPFVTALPFYHFQKAYSSSSLSANGFDFISLAYLATWQFLILFSTSSVNTSLQRTICSDYQRNSLH